MTMTSSERLVQRLVGIINDPDRPAALKCIAYIHYPPRGIAIREVENSREEVSLAIWGHEYKCRQKPKFPPVIDRLKILLAFERELAPDYRVVSVKADTKNVRITFEERNGE